MRVSTPAAPETRRAIPKVSPQQASSSQAASSGIESEVESLARQLAELERYAQTYTYIVSWTHVPG